MKKIILFLLLISIILGAILIGNLLVRRTLPLRQSPYTSLEPTAEPRTPNSQALTAEPWGTWKQYHNPEYGFSFSYPGSWMIRSEKKFLDGNFQIEISGNNQSTVSITITDQDENTLVNQVANQYPSTKARGTDNGRIKYKNLSWISLDGFINDNTNQQYYRSDYISSFSGKTYWFRFLTPTEFIDPNNGMFNQLVASFGPYIPSPTLPKADMPYLGVRYSMIDSKTAKLNGLPEGATVIEVVPKSPAEIAGIQSGDIITQIDKTQVRVGNGDLIKLLAKYNIGDIVTLTLVRLIEIPEPGSVGSATQEQHTFNLQVKLTSSPF